MTADEWNGICACGKAAMDGVRCRLGATHQPRLRMPWEVQNSSDTSANSSSKPNGAPFPW